MKGLDEDGTTSFDPKTWSAGASGADRITPDPTSFDPKAWTDAGSASPAPPEPSPPTPRRRGAILGGAAVLLLVAGAGAAWLSRAPAGPQPIAPVQTPAVAPTASADLTASRRTLVVASAALVGDTLAGTGMPAADAKAAAAAAVEALGHAPGDIRLVIDLVGPDDARRMTRLEATRSDGSGVVLTARAEGGYASELRQARLITEVRVVRGEMDDTSFYNAAVTAGVTDTLISDIAKAFAFDFNFATDVHAGDIFEAAFEQKVNPAGEAVGPPTLIYVSLQTAEKAKSLYRFLAPGDTEPGWYDGNGRSTITALMRTPVDGARISSPFGMRFHPVLHFNKLHKGTDFAAPIGTPIYAAGTGTIEWAAMKGPNGNLTILRHDNGWQTYYLHQSMFMPGIAPGAHVTQGQKIGEIGTTGRSTGPHLHFELHVDGQPVDPMSVDSGTGKVLGGEALAAFRKERDRIDVSRAAPTS